MDANAGSGTNVGNTLDHVKITSIPSNGVLSFDGNDLDANDLPKSVVPGDFDKLKYTPPANANGDNYTSFKFKVNDSQDDSELEYTIRFDVTPVNDAPTAMNDDAETAEQTAVEIEVVANDEDIDGDTDLSVTRVGTADGMNNTATEINPGKGTVTITPGSTTTVTYTPNPDFNSGTDTFTYVVSDGELTDIGTVTVTMISDESNARLSGLAVSTGTLEPDFSASTTSYTASVPNDVASLTVTPTTERTSATVTVDDVAVTNDNPSDAIPLAVGNNTITVVVTAEDDTTTRAYTITVTRAPNAKLSALTLSAGTLTPLFDANSTSYTASVANAVESLTVMPTTANNNATVTVDGTVVARGNASDPILLAEGDDTTITVVVTAEDVTTTTKTYTIVVTRAPSTNADLSDLTLSQGSLNETFASDTTSYTASVANAVESLTVTPTRANSNATVTVDGTAVARGSASDAILLAEGDDTTITVVVTPQDQNAAQKTYTITVTRAPSTNADLSALTLSAGTLTPLFDANSTSYSASVANAVESLTVTPTTANNNATVTVDGTVVASDSASADITLAEGDDTIITVVVTPQDKNAAQKTYTITVTRAPSTNADLSALTLSAGTLTPLFDADSTSYSASVANAVESLTVTPTTANNNATVTVDGTVVARGNASDAILLAEGDDTIITVVVTPQDKDAAQKTYTITVTRAPSTNADLSALTLSAGTLTPLFDADSTSYSASVANAVESLTVTPTRANNNATVTVDGTVVARGNASDAILLAEGDDTIITVVVTPQDKDAAQKTYTITVTRAPSTNADLSALTLSAGTLTPLFDADSTSYSASVANAVESLTVTPTRANNNATVTVDGTVVARGNASDAILLAEGDDTIIRVVVTPQDKNAAQKTYTITVNREASSNATLSTLSLLAFSTGSQQRVPLTPEFDPDIQQYRVNVQSGVESVTLMPTTHHAKATVTVNGSEVTNGSASNAITLIAAETTTIDVLVTAQDETTRQRYSIAVSRATAAASTDATLSTLSLSAGDLAFAVDTTSYSVDVANSVASLSVNATPSDSNATLSVNGKGVENGNDSEFIDLIEGDETTITVVVTAQDANTEQTYTITVNREASSNATLSTLSLLAFSTVSPQQLPLTPQFHPDTHQYRVNVQSGVESVTLTPTTHHAKATVKVDDVAVESGSASNAITLTAAETTTIDVVVTAQDGTTRQRYSIAVSRAAAAASIDATLSALSLSAGDLAFDADTTSYSVNVANSVASLSVNATPSDPNATLSVNGKGVENSSDSAPIALAEGAPTTITVVVTAEDANTEQTYTITVNREASSNATLSGLSLLAFSTVSQQQLPLTPQFHPDTYQYRVNVENGVESLTLTPTTDNANATVTVDGSTVTSGSASNAITLIAAETTTIDVLVTAQDGTTRQRYSIAVSRAAAAASTDATLSALSLSAGDLTFDADTTSYSVNVANSVASVSVNATPSDPSATLSVNGKGVENGSDSEFIDLIEGDETTITVVVTAEDANTEQTYTITVNREASSNATLSGLSLLAFSTVSPQQLPLTPQFDPDTHQYRVNVQSGVERVTLTPTTANQNATVTVNGTAVTSGSASNAITLTAAETATIDVLVTAQDGTTRQRYSIAVSRAAAAASTDATLSTLSLSAGDLAFAADITSYSVNVANSVASVSVNATPSDSNATLSVNGKGVENSSDSAPIDLAEGAPTSITVVVTAEDANTEQTYTITVNREASSNATLSGLSLLAFSTVSPQQLPLTPQFDPDTHQYRVNVQSGVERVTLTPTTANQNATVTVNGTAVTSGSASNAITLIATETTTINVLVTAQDGTTRQRYSIAVSRAAAATSSDVTLSTLSLSAGDLTFAADITSYSVDVANSVASLSVNATPSDPNATLSVNGKGVENGSDSEFIDLIEGDETTITVVVTAEDANTEQTYTITVNREASSNATLSTLSLLAFSTGSQQRVPLTPEFDPDIHQYRVNVESGVESVTLMPTTHHAKATVTVNGTAVTNGSASNAITLIAAETTTIDVLVTAQDGTTRQRYSIAVSRAAAAASTDATLSALSLSAGDLAFAADTTSYSVNVANSVASVSVNATPSDPNATLSVNGKGVENGNDSEFIDLIEGDETTITVVVKAEDANTEQTYTITVNREASSNATLSTLSLLAFSTGSQQRVPLTPQFHPDIHQYRVNVQSGVESVTLTPTTDNAKATVKVNDVAVESGSASNAITLIAAETTTIDVLVTAQDGTTRQRYSIAVSRAAAAASTDATLSVLSLSAGDLTFAADTTSYSVNVANSVASLSVNATPSDSNATLSVNGKGVENGNDSEFIDLIEGYETTITVVVTAEDANTEQTYTITVNREASSNATLSTLSLLAFSTGSQQRVPLTPEFDPDIQQYRVNVQSGVESVTLTPTTHHAKATVKVDDVAVESGSASNAITLTAAETTTIDVVVTAQDETTTQRYSIAVSRAAAAASTDATLSTLSLSAGDLAFAVDTTSYSVDVANSVASLSVNATPSDSNATLSVNGKGVENSSDSAPIDLAEGAPTTITVVVKAEDANTEQTYTITVNREASSNATLSGLSLLAFSTVSPQQLPLTPQFDPDTHQYRVNVQSGVERVTLTPTTANQNATVTVDGSAVTSGSASNAITLTAAETTTIDVLVTAQDGTTRQRYSIAVSRAAAAASTDATLSTLSLSAGDLAFAVDTTSYSVDVANSVASLSVNATPSDPNATLSVNGKGVENGSDSAPIDLAEGAPTFITVVVTAEDANTTRAYTITVTRAPSTNATLSGLSLLTFSTGSQQQLPLTPEFDPDTHQYRVNVQSGVESVTLMPTTHHAKATVKVDDVAVESGSASNAITLTAAETTTIDVVVTAQDGTTTQRYSITVSRAAADASTDATLSALSLSGLADFGFDPAIIEYEIDVANSVARLSVNATPSDPSATLSVNGKGVENGSDSAPIDLAEGAPTFIKVVVTAEDANTTRAYTITVTRAPSTNATLSTLSLLAFSTGSQQRVPLTPQFHPDIHQYRVNVQSGVESVTLTPTTANQNATVTVDGTAVTRGSASNAITLTAAETTTIDVVVTAQDGETTQTYSITVTRAAAAASRDATLSALSLSSLADFGFDPAIIEYEINVANSVASLSVNATPSDSKATLSVNGKGVENSSDSEFIDLAEGAPTSITVVVTAEDANTTRAYTITVNRVPEDILKLPSDFAFTSETLTLSPAFDPDTMYYTLNADKSLVHVPTIPNRKGVTVEVRANGIPLPKDRMVELERNTPSIITITLTPDFMTSPLSSAVKSTARDQVAAAEDATANTYTITVLPPWPMVSGTLEPLTLYAGGEDGSRNGSAAFNADNAGEIMWHFASSDPAVASVKPESSGSSTVVVTPVREGEATITVRVVSGDWMSDPASFPVTVRTSAAEQAAIHAALSGHGRVVLGSVTDMIGERFDSGTGGTGASGNVCISSAARADGDSGDNTIAVSRGSHHGDSSDDIIASDTWQGESWNTDLAGMGLRGVPHIGHRGEDSMDKTFDDLLKLFRGRPHSLHPADWTADCGSGTVGEVSRPWTLWAGTDLQWARGGTATSDFDGAWDFLYLGADRAFAEQWLGGLSLSRVWGEVDYSFEDAAAAGGGQLSSSLSAVYPYLHGQLSSNLELWAIGGIGFGDMENEREHVDGDADQGDLHMQLLSVGLRRSLSQAGSAMDLALSSDAGFVTLSTEGERSLDGAEVSIGRFRLGLELSRPFANGVEPFAQLHGRYDSGDGPGGAAGEMVLGLRYGDERFNLELRGNHLTSVADFEQWGANARLDYSPATDGTGLNLALTSQWGAAENGDSFLDGHSMELPTPALVSAQGGVNSLPAEISGEIGYSLSMGQQWGILTPNLGYDHSDNGTSRSRVGLAYALSSDLGRDIELRLDLARTERRQEDPDHSIELGASLRF